MTKFAVSNRFAMLSRNLLKYVCSVCITLATSTGILVLLELANGLKLLRATALNSSNIFKFYFFLSLSAKTCSTSF